MPYLGCIADDFTGGTDVASMLTRHGLRTIQTIGVPRSSLANEVDAIVVALKSRTIPPDEAVQQSLQALQYLLSIGCKQIYFKYCSTFDSTDRGNIGPVTDALMSALGTGFTIACPAFPENKRTIYKGYLFVGDVLLNESGMQNHPLTPMRAPNLVRVLQRQTSRKVCHISSDVVAAGSEAIRSSYEILQMNEGEIAIVDALGPEDILSIGQACYAMPLVTAGSGVALGIAADLIHRGIITRNDAAASLPPVIGKQAIIAGSCSLATQQQVAYAKSHGIPAFSIDPLAISGGEPIVQRAIEWAKPKFATGPILFYATANQEQVKSVQKELGTERAGAIVEDALAAIAKALVEEYGVTQLIVAGGETSGAVVKALQIDQLRIGPMIAPGVPWTQSMGNKHINLALKSGNFGTVDLFLSAWRLLTDS